MTMSRLLGTSLLAAAVLLAACGDTADSDSGTSLPEDTNFAAPTTTPGTQGPDPSDPSAGDAENGDVPVSDTLEPAGAVTGGNVERSYEGLDYPQELTGLVGLAITDLAERLNITTDDVSVVLLEEVVWSDAGLGCPEPGMVYAQVLTDGMRLILGAEGQLYDYRSGGSAEPRLCIQAADKDDSRAGVFELTEEGDIIFVPNPGNPKAPSEGLNPPDK